MKKKLFPKKNNVIKFEMFTPYNIKVNNCDCNYPMLGQTNQKTNQLRFQHIPLLHAYTPKSIKSPHPIRMYTTCTGFQWIYGMKAHTTRIGNHVKQKSNKQISNTMSINRYEMCPYERKFFHWSEFLREQKYTDSQHRTESNKCVFAFTDWSLNWSFFA